MIDPKAIAFWLPLSQATVSGIFAGLCAWFVAKYLDWPDPFLFGLAIWLLVAGWSWIAYRSRSQDLLEGIFLPEVSQVLPDDPIPNAGEVVAPIRVSVNSPQKSMFIDVPGDPSKVASFARQVLKDGNLSMAAWSGPGKSFSRSEYETLRNALAKRGLIILKNADAPGQGYVLSAVGRAVLKRLGDPPAPAPDMPPQASYALRTRAHSLKRGPK